MPKKQNLILGLVIFFVAFGLGMILENNKPRQFVIVDDIQAETAMPTVTPAPVVSTDVSQESIAPEETKININTATQGELDRLDGIGEKLAARIIRYREEHGNFEVIEDIMQVSGIGQKRFANIKQDICVE